MTRTPAPFGSWPTPITSERVVQSAVRLGGVALVEGSVWWSESRPQESGRTAIVRDGVDVLCAPWNARSAVHEYGGGAWWVAADSLFFTNWADQRVYRVDSGCEPVAITPEPTVSRGDRYADADIHPDGEYFVCVREHHREGATPADVVNEIVLVPTNGSAVDNPNKITVIGTGPDFVSDPRFSPSGARVCWIEWDHPNMPWDETRLVIDGTVVVEAIKESISQPRWISDDELLFISDRTGWWNLYRYCISDQTTTSVVAIDAEIGGPQWAFGLSRYDVLADGRIALAYKHEGFDHFAIADGTVLTKIKVDVTAIASITAQDNDVLFIGASPTTEAQLYKLTIDATDPAIKEMSIVRKARELGVDPAWYAMAQSIDFPSNGRTSHALFYPPTSPTHEGPSGQLPPLIVMIHGGPTSAASPTLNISTQYWTSRGFAVVDVDYGGSTGYGREYRDLLQGSWGVVDVQDCEAAAQYLVDQHLVDADRLCITGGSAGGFTVLAALSLGNTFSVGASHYGVADLEALAQETHKFESHYLDGLIGTYPEQREIYIERSPIHHLDGFDRPLIVLQGLDDEVVPPIQSQMIVDALTERGVPVSYVAFPGEQHGFRQAPNMRKALDSELSFYGQVFGFELPQAEHIKPVEILNRSAITTRQP